VLGILDQHPHDDPLDPLRVPLEAHLEGLAYTGTAATEKTIRSVDPDGIASHVSIEQMIRAVKADAQPREHQEFGHDFEAWWMGAQRGTRYAQTARDLRNDAAHDVYEKSPEGPRWQMRLERRRPVALDQFALGYSQELNELEALLVRTEELARVAA
jgi:hypothetical protein